MRRILRLLSYSLVLFILLFSAYCLSFASASKQKIERYYQKHKGNQKASKSLGIVSNGTLENAKLIPFYGKNYSYFDEWSYLNGRAFLNDKVLKTVLSTYQSLEKQLPTRHFKVMECAHEHGGKLFPHRTHQNGLSVDFMMPLKREGKPHYDIDSKGIKNYLLDFDDQGKWEKDNSIEIDFEAVAQHILLSDQNARKNGYYIKKVIIKIELKDDLFKGHYGKKLKQSGIYVVKALTPKINALHDDHYHIDFEKLGN